MGKRSRSRRRSPSPEPSPDVSVGDPASDQEEEESGEEDDADGHQQQPESWKDADFLSFDDTTTADADAGGGGKIPIGLDKGSRSSSRYRETTTITATTTLPPWMDTPNDYRRVNPLVALHNEIVAFCSLMEPMPSELRQREDLIEQVTELVNNTFEDAPVKVLPFGSFATGLLLPTSDIDLVIHSETILATTSDDPTKRSIPPPQVGETSGTSNGNGEKNGPGGDDDEEENWKQKVATPLQRFAAALRSKWIDHLSYLEAVENTRVPLVKFTHFKTNISVDVCFDQVMGPPAATLMKTYMDAMPPLRPLTFVLKYFLAARGLNEPYSGGVGSFLLQLLIVSFLQHRERFAYNYRQQTVYNLGALLLEFFKLYGFDFNYATTGISVRSDGFYFPKGSKDRKELFFTQSSPFRLALENPLDPSLDVGKSSFRIQLIQRAFALAHGTLMAHVSQPFEPTPSILGTILPVSNEMLERKVLKRRDRPLSAHRHGDPRDSSGDGSGRRRRR